MLLPSCKKDLSHMLKNMGTTDNHFGSSCKHLDLDPHCGDPAAHGDPFTASVRLHTLITFVHFSCR